MSHGIDILAYSPREIIGGTIKQREKRGTRVEVNGSHLGPVKWAKNDLCQSVVISSHIKIRTKVRIKPSTLLIPHLKISEKNPFCILNCEDESEP